MAVLSLPLAQARQANQTNTAISATDSLTQWLLNNRRPSQRRVKALNLLAGYWRSSKPNLAQTYAQQALEQAQALKLPLQQAKSLHLLGQISWQQGLYGNSQELYEQSLALYVQQTDTAGMVSVKQSQGLLYAQQGLYVNAITLFKGAHAMAQQAGSPPVQASLLTQIGQAYHQLKEYPHAQDYYQKALQVVEPNTLAQSRTLANLGNVYLEQGKYKAAQQHFTQSLAISKNIEDLWSQSRTLVSLGLIDYKTGKYNSCLQYFKQGDEIAQNMGDMSLKAQIHSYCYDAFVKMGNMEKAREHWGKSYALATNMQAKGLEMELYHRAMQFDSLSNNYQSAMVHGTQYMHLKDSLMQAQQNAQLRQLEVLVQNERQRRENEILKATNAAYTQRIDRQSTLILIGAALLLLFGAMLLYIFRVNKSLNRKNTRIVAQKNEIAKQSKQMQELYHEIAATNDNLEAIVNTRTQELSLRNNQLASYAFMNAHNVRGPLARILGLIQLIDINAVKENEHEQLWGNLRNSAFELDSVIKSINTQLEQEPEGTEVNTTATLGAAAHTATTTFKAHMKVNHG